MIAYSKPFGGYYRESYQDQIYGSGNGDRIVSTTRMSSSLFNVTSGVSPVINGKRRLTYNNQSYVHDVNYGTYGNVTQTRTTPDGRTYYYNKTGDYGTQGGMIIHPDLGSYNQALGRLGDIIRGSIDLSIDAFQVGQTIQLVKRLFSVRKIVEHLASKTWKDTSAQRRRYSKLIRDEAYALKRRKLPGRVAHAALHDNPMKDVGGLYLEFTYGLQPTMQTIHDLVMGSATRLGNQIVIKRQGSAKSGVSGKFKDSTVSKTQDKQGSYDSIYESTYTTRFGGSYVPGTGYVESLSRLTSLNPASIAWELLPFSFVVDWFYDVGGYLRAIETSLTSLGQFNGYQTVSSRHTVLEVVTYFGPDVQGNIWSGGTTNKLYRQSKNRSRITSVPLPRPPHFTADLGAKRLVNAAALLSQFLGSKRK